MKVLVLVHNGFEEAEMIVTVDILRRAGIDAKICSMTGKKTLIGNKNIEVAADLVMDKRIDADKFAKEYEAVVLPGGGPNAFSLKDDDRAGALVKAFDKAGKTVAAICAAPIVLEKAGLTDGKTVTSYTDMLDRSRCDYQPNAKAVRDGNIITSCGPAGCLAFGYEIVTALCGASVADKIKSDMLY